MTDKTKPTGSNPDHVLGGPLERDVLAAMPLLVRRAAKVCRCGHLETEHNLTPTGRRTGCSHAAGAGVCACLAFEHAVDRYAASTYVDVPAGAPAPALRLERGDTDSPRASLDEHALEVAAGSALCGHRRGQACQDCLDTARAVVDAWRDELARHGA